MPTQKHTKKSSTEFWAILHIDPPTTTAQQHRFGGYDKNGKAIIYDSPKLKEARAILMDYLGLYAPRVKMGGPLELSVTWTFAVKDKTKWGKRKTTKPDTDNLQKLLKDCMTRTFYWEDDAQVCREVVEKYWGEKGSIEITVRKLEDET